MVQGGKGGTGRRSGRGAALLLGVVVLVTSVWTGVAGAAAASDPGKGQGVTADSVKIGLVQVDYDCIKQFVDFNRGDQEKTYQVFVDDLNANGGIGGRKVEGVFREFCPIGNTQALATCTQFTEDDNVFAVVGVFIDQSGDAQLCIAKAHKTVEIIHNVSQTWMDQVSPGLLLTPDITPERRLNVILDLLQARKTLQGKKVAVLAQAETKARVDSTIDPALKKMKVKRGSTAVVTISQSDPTAAQTQLDSFIERWKTEKVDAIVITGQVVVAKSFVTRLRQDLPDVTLIADQAPTALSAGQDAVVAGTEPNPYDGLITAEGEGEQARFETPAVQRCVDIYEKATKTKVVAPADIKPGADGKRTEIYASIEDACTELTLFKTIAEKAGKQLTNRTWAAAVKDLGPLDNLLAAGKWASIHQGKYDANDTFGLVSFDPKSGRSGDWKSLTPVQNVSGT